MRQDQPTAERKQRGAFFTPRSIAGYLARWAVADDPSARVLDPTCGESVFLVEAGRRLSALTAANEAVRGKLYGVELHRESLEASRRRLEAAGVGARLLAEDFFLIPTPDQLGGPLPFMDAVIGNPPYVRYQEHSGENRRRSAAAALRQGVRLTGLASSWASVLVHACAFLKPTGRLAMVLPAELLTVGYAEPVRQWLRERFAQVHLVFFDTLQFEGALEKVVLLVARGSGGCDAFSLWYVEHADELASLAPFDNYSVTPATHGKWTDLLLPMWQRQLFKRAVAAGFTPLSGYGSPELGTVTGANHYFVLTESRRQAYGLSEGLLRPVVPPGTKHLKGTSFTRRQWESLRDNDEQVWLLYPDRADGEPSLLGYLAVGVSAGVPDTYKCKIRTPWWRPPAVTPPDLFFTYMSHRYPRLIANTAAVTFLNSMHGIRLAADAPSTAKRALPLLTLNSVTMLGGELFGRSYGGGLLKMEPREAAVLPVPRGQVLDDAWARIRPERDKLERWLLAGRWADVVRRVDDVLLRDVLGLSAGEIAGIADAARALRRRRIGKED